MWIQYNGIKSLWKTEYLTTAANNNGKGLSVALKEREDLSLKGYIKVKSSWKSINLKKKIYIYTVFVGAER